MKVERATTGTSPARGAAAGKPQRIAREIRALINSRGLDEGDLLGTEAELLDRFTVSRPSLREALRILEADGLVSVVRGAQGGVMVHRPDQRMTARAAAHVLRSRRVSLADVFEASAVIEPAAARMVATSRGHRRAAEQLRRSIVEQRRTVEDPIACTNAVITFHTDIVRFSDNQTLLIVFEMLNEVIDRAISDVQRRTLSETTASRRRTIRSHETLADLVATGDGDGAQAHWTAHMSKLRRSLLGERGAAVIDIDDYL